MRLFRRLAVCALFAVVGCDKPKPIDDDSGGGGSAGSKATQPVGRPSPGAATAAERVAQQSPASSLPSTRPKTPNTPDPVGVGQWMQLDDVAVRIDSVSVAKPKYVAAFRDFEHTLDEVKLVVRYTVANNSKTKKLEYSRPGGSYSRALKLIDEHGNDYTSYPFDSLDVVEGCKGHHTLYPGDPAIADVIAFQRPVPAAKELRLTIDATWTSTDYQFRIPASAWKR